MRTAICIMLTVVLLAGCAPAHNNASPSPRNQQNGARVQNVNENTNPNTNNAAPEQGQVNQATASHLKAIAEKVPGVNSANCVVMGNTAVVGVNVDGSLDRADVGTIKYTVAEALRKDPAGANALVTADLDLNNRIADLNRHIQEGNPISGLAAELADIVGRIVPQLPRDVAPGNDETGGETGGEVPQTMEPRANTPAAPRHQHNQGQRAPGNRGQ
ncbi:YhcN/YlaJ family sporulation lipoprotein [Paenibacillus sp. 7541]|uniref:Sporulation protein n=3 Tax=Paenibacillus TaxID=44249 RepID=A0A268F4X2_9BACL|nr:YhcN/YlaJ family sporulation lipoprotein [Paenibacillus sp. 7541]MUG64632.1 YhcN/YlaJ family sporulation lipoprotein [Paenibacillus campinasensis]PAD80423.1 sporulation protein [Paenibacillus campinasensis]PAK55553.1 sporulation protein [Paenibacillus sp. 7541]